MQSAPGDDQTGNIELVIGECELTPEGITWINQFDNSVPNSVRRALELFKVISENWNSNYTPASASVFPGKAIGVPLQYLDVFPSGSEFHENKRFNV